MLLPVQIPDYPGLHEEWTVDLPFFERAYDVGNDLVMRARFTPVFVDNGMDNVSIPIHSRQISIMASASLVDADGQVIFLRGRGMVRPAISFTQELVPGFDQETFLLQVAMTLATDIVTYRQQVVSASLLIPPVIVEELEAEDEPELPPAPSASE